MIGRLTALAAAFYLAWQWNERRHQRERLLRTPKAKPEEVTTWEGEGGALRATGAQLGPDPALP